MIGLGSVLGLSALAAVLIPLVLHLLSLRWQRPLPFPTLRWIESSAASRGRSLRLSELPLLAVRVALLVLLALIVAGLFWRPSADSPARSGWVLVAPELLSAPLPSSAYSTIDSLVSAGYSLRLLSEGFPAVKLEDSIQHQSLADAWSLAREADAALTPSAELVIVASPLLRSYSGVRPELSARVRWLSPLSEARTASWRGARLRNAKGAWQRSWRSDALSSSSTWQKVLATDSTPAALKVGIYSSGDFAAEVPYWSAAWRSLETISPRSVRVSQVVNTQLADKQFDVLMWLSDAPVPADWWGRTRDGGLLVVPSRAVVRPMLTPTTSQSDAELPSVAVYASRPVDTGRPILSSATGEVLISAADTGLGRIVYLGAGVLPNASSLGERALPHLVLELLYPTRPAFPASRKDQRHIAASQKQPELTAVSSAASVLPSAAGESLTLWLGLLAALVFLAERYLADRK